VCRLYSGGGASSPLTAAMLTTELCLVMEKAHGKARIHTKNQRSLGPLHNVLAF